MPPLSSRPRERRHGRRTPHICVSVTAGATVDPKVDDSEFGRFGWATDPEGNRIELWQPK